MMERSRNFQDTHCHLGTIWIDFRVNLTIGEFTAMFVLNLINVW